MTISRKVGAAALIPVERIERNILIIRGHKVMLSPDLAALYGVAPRVLIQAVKRNAARFPADFMFMLTPKETASLRSQFVILKTARGRHPKFPPYAFTQEGVAMLSSVLRSKQAAAVNIQVMRAFVKLRQLLSTNTALARKLAELESRYDGQFKVVFAAIRELMTPPPTKKRRIGF